MNDDRKTKKQLIHELLKSRQRIAALEASGSKQAKGVLRESEDRLRNLFEAMGEGVILIDPHGRIIQANPAAMSILRLTRSELEGRNYFSPEFKFIHLDGTPLWPEEMAAARAIKEKSPVRNVVMGVERPDGTTCWINVSASPLMDETGRLEGVVGTFSDITERRWAEEALRQSEEKLRSLVQNIPDIILFLAQDGIILSANRTMPGITVQEMIGKRIYDYIDPEYFELIRKSIKAVFRSGRPDNFQMLGVGPREAETAWYETRVVPIEKDNKVIAVTLICTDITERRNAEEEKERLLTELFQSQKMESIGLLAGGMAHDFNNVLSNIQAKAYRALRRLPEDDPAREDLDEIRNICFTAGSLTRKLMQVGWEQPVELNPIALNGGILEILGLLDQLVGRDFAIVRELAEDLWTVNADKTCIEQIIMNLVLNAKDAMTEGGTISVKTRNKNVDEDYAKAHHHARPGEFVCLTVSDTGCGMDKETLSHIFEPFYSKKGTGKLFGVGLTVVYGIVKKHKGWIDVESRVGEGSIFRVFFPSIPELPKEEADKIASTEEYHGRGERILVVEDDEPTRIFIEGILRENGYIVFPAKNAEEAFTLFTKEKGNFHMVFADVFLPDESGVKLADRLRALAPAQRILFGSGYLNVKAAEFKIIRESGHWLLEKPYDKLKLLRITRELLQQPSRSPHKNPTDSHPEMETSTP